MSVCDGQLGYSSTRPKGAWVIGLALAVAMAMAWGYGCTRSSKKVTEPTAAKLSAAEQKTLEEYQAEIEIGRNMAGRLLGYYGRIDSDKLTGYVNQVGNYVAGYGDYPDRRYMFAVLKHESVNAFACPGGYILVTLGAIRNATNEAELAAILGHEVAHVGRRHMFDTLRRMEEKDLAEAAKRRAAGVQDDPTLNARRRPVAAETGMGAILARHLTGSSGAALNVLQAAQAGMSLITEKGLDKALEYEADQEGVKYAIRAGYEPKAMLAYLQRLEQKSETKVKNLEKTHPPVKARRKEIEVLLKTLSADDIVGATGEARFEKVYKTLPKPEKN